MKTSKKTNQRIATCESEEQDQRRDERDQLLHMSILTNRDALIMIDDPSECEEAPYDPLGIDGDNDARLYQRTILPAE